MQGAAFSCFLAAKTPKHEKILLLYGSAYLSKWFSHSGEIHSKLDLPYELPYLSPSSPNTSTHRCLPTCGRPLWKEKLWGFSFGESRGLFSFFF